LPARRINKCGHERGLFFPRGNPARRKAHPAIVKNFLIAVFDFIVSFQQLKACCLNYRIFSKNPPTICNPIQNFPSPGESSQDIGARARRWPPCFTRAAMRLKCELHRKPAAEKYYHLVTCGFPFLIRLKYVQVPLQPAFQKRKSWRALARRFPVRRRTNVPAFSVARFGLNGDKPGSKQIGVHKWITACVFRQKIRGRRLFSLHRSVPDENGSAVNSFHFPFLIPPHRAGRLALPAAKEKSHDPRRRGHHKIRRHREGVDAVAGGDLPAASAGCNEAPGDIVRKYGNFTRNTAAWAAWRR